MTVRTIKRRTLYVALTLLLLMGGAWWGTRPGIDPRLVGTWQLSPGSYGPVGFKLLADGSVEIASNVRLVDVEHLPRPWKVEGNILFFSQQDTTYQGWTNWVELELRSAWEKLVSPADVYSRWRIIEVTANSLKIQSLDEGQKPSTSSYYRLPDGAEIDTHPMPFLNSW